MYMECIAQVRFGFCFASKMFHKYYCSEDALQKLPSSTKVKLEQLCHCVKRIVTDGVIREPRDFLVKQLVRQYGFTYLDILSKKEKFKDWIIEASQGDAKHSDDFVVCGSKYLELRSQWCYSTVSLETFEEELMNNPVVENHVTVYITLFRRLLTVSEECSIPMLLSRIRNETKSINGFHEQFLQILNGKNCDSILLKNVTFSPWTAQKAKKISTVIVHFATVIGAVSVKEISFFHPFASILKDIEDLKTYFWPALPDDILDLVMGVKDNDKKVNTYHYDGIGSWWKCVNGHPYFVGDCGNPINPGQEGKNMSYTCCYDCGVPIGGRDLRQNTKTKLDSRTGYTKPGHWLDPPNRRTLAIPTSERDLSPLSHCVMLVLIHASCVWATSSFNPETYKHLVESIVQDSQILELDVFTFFWNHLEKDIEMLCRATQLCFDDCILVLNAIIHNMLQQSTKIPDANLPLKSRELRQTWEKAFDETFIQPFTKDIESSIKLVRNLVIDDSKDHKKLYEMIYEKKNYDATTKIDPHLWIYRPIITIDHVAQSLQQQKDLTNTMDLKVLEEFLKNVEQLTVLQYLPDVVQMQSTLHEICNHRIDKHETEDMNIEAFLQAYISKEHQKSKLIKEVKSFCIAWNTVREELPKQTMVGLDRKYAAVEMTLSQPLAHFIPMIEGNVCSIALATYLAKLQNDCIERSWRKLAKSELSTFKVPIQRIQRNQMIHFEEQITNVIFSHCKYSLKAGHGADIVYDFVALEKHILDRFVRGKPLIDIRFPGMSYRSDVIEALTFRSIRQKIKQSPLSQRDKDDIIVAIHVNQCLQECIDIVNVTLGFIQYGNWQPQHMMKRCLVALKLDKKLPKIIEDKCEVKHLISLWRILNVEQSRQLVNGKEDPFTDIKSVFKHDLDQEEQELLKKELQPYDIDQFIEVFYEFIATHVKNSGENETDYPLTDAYIDVCDYFELEKIKHFEEKFPSDFSLKHVTEIWKYAIAYQKQQSEH